MTRDWRIAAESRAASSVFLPTFREHTDFCDRGLGCAYANRITDSFVNLHLSTYPKRNSHPGDVSKPFVVPGAHTARRSPPGMSSIDLAVFARQLRSRANGDNNTRLWHRS